MNKYEVNYQYKNNDDYETEVWFSVPYEAEVSEVSIEPENISESDGHHLKYFVVKPGEKLELKYYIQPKSLNKDVLTEDEKAFYTRASNVCYWDSETTEQAIEIIGNESDVFRQAERLFNFVVESFKYVYPPRARGIQSFMETKKGDCGEFSQMYASLCRSVGIPCRSLYGAWSYGTMQGHVWNEVYIEGKGWIEADTSMANLQRYSKWKFFFSSLKTYHWKDYFGESTGQKITFSYDSDIRLEPLYKAADHYNNIVERFEMCGVDFQWGTQAFSGKAPYLQPAYVKYNEKRTRKVKVKELMGSWKIKEPNPLGLFRGMKITAACLLTACFLLSILTPYTVPGFVIGLVLLAAVSAYILRGERKIFFSILAFIVVFILIRSIL